MKLFLALIGLIVSCIFWGSIYAASAGTMPDHDYMNEIKEIHEQAAVNAQSKGLNVMNEYFARGNEGIYVINPEKTDWILFTEADPETFEIISGRFAKDHDSIFSGFHILRGIDRDTFAVVSGEHGYAADTNRVYGPEFVVDKADPETFRMFNRNYAQDIARVFFRGRELGGADAGSFEALNENYAKDEDHVYYLGKKIKGADVQTFEVMGLYRAKDGKGGVFFEGQSEKDAPDLDDLFEDEKGEIKNEKGDESEMGDELGGMSNEEKTKNQKLKTKNGSWFSTFFHKLTGKDIPVSGIHGAYAIFFGIVGLIVLMILYRLLSGRMGERPSITRSIINIVGSVVVATLVFWIIKMLTGVTGVYSPLLVFFLILFLILFLFGISTFANIVENIMTSLLTIIIGAVITLIAFFVIDKLVDTSSFIQQLANPLVFTNVTLTIASIILISIIYQMTTKIGWFMSFVRSLIAVIVSCSLLILVQKLFSMSNILATVGIFHVFLAIVLFLLGMRNTENKVIYIAQVSRVTVLHLAIMFIVFLVVKGFLV